MIRELLELLKESRAMLFALLSALLLGVVLCMALGSNAPPRTCQVSPRWLLVNVMNTSRAIESKNDSYLDKTLDAIQDVFQGEPEPMIELGPLMLDTCRIGQIRAGLNSCPEAYPDCTVIDLLLGPDVVLDQITVEESTSAICAALDCGDATRAKVPQPSEARMAGEPLE